MRSFLSSNGRILSMGIFQISLHFIKYKASSIGQLELMIWGGFVRLVRHASLTDLCRRISTNLRLILSFTYWAMVGIMDWIGPIRPLCEVIGWRYILVVVDDFSRFVWARGYETANQEALHDVWLKFFIPVFGFPLCIFHDNCSHCRGADITAFFKSYGTT